LANIKATIWSFYPCLGFQWENKASAQGFRTNFSSRQYNQCDYSSSLNKESEVDKTKFEFAAKAFELWYGGGYFCENVGGLFKGDSWSTRAVSADKGIVNYFALG